MPSKFNSLHGLLTHLKMRQLKHIQLKDDLFSDDGICFDEEYMQFLLGYEEGLEEAIESISDFINSK